MTPNQLLVKMWRAGASAEEISNKTNIPIAAVRVIVRSAMVENQANA